MKTINIALVLLLSLNGCAVLTVAGAAVSVTTTAIGVAADVAVGAVKGVVKAGSMAVDAATSKPAPSPAPITSPAVTEPAGPVPRAEPEVVVQPLR